MTENGKNTTKHTVLSTLKDEKVRLIMIPALGILIPNISGLFENLPMGSPKYWLSYGWFILLSYLLWQGNRYFLFQQRKYFDWFNQPFRKAGIMIFANVFFTLPVTVVFLVLWYRFIGFDGVNENRIRLVSLINVISVIFITHIYETAFLIRERELDLLQVEKMEKAQIKAELQALKNQIDPHFMFNSLNTLTYLLNHDLPSAKKFNEYLSDVYRYLIQNRKRDLVPFGDELRFTQQYIKLMQIRFQNALDINFHRIDEASYMIIPISLQTLIENALKHNEAGVKHPLKITIYQDNDVIVVENPVRLRKTQHQKTSSGLQNLSERCTLVTGRPIVIRSDESVFNVQIPLIPIHAYTLKP